MRLLIAALFSVAYIVGTLSGQTPVNNLEMTAAHTSKVEQPAKAESPNVTVAQVETPTAPPPTSQPEPMPTETPAPEVSEPAPVATPAPVAQPIENQTPVPQSSTGMMSAAGISPSDYAAVDFIVSRESGWNTSAVNPYSGSCGLVQELPCGKSGCTFGDGVCQLRWATSYAISVYGSWWSAQAFWSVHSWW